MKKKTSIRITLFVISLVIIALFVSCQDADKIAASALEGKWVLDTSDYDSDYVRPEDVIIFNDGNFEMKYDGTSTDKGTYTISSNLLTLTITHVWGASKGDGLEAKWYSKAEIIQFYKKQSYSRG
jgi:hypothetical protein